MWWASTRENLFSGFANYKDADHPVHPHILINTFVIRFLESIISKLATRDDWFESCFVGNPPKTGFVMSRPQ